VTAGGLRLTLPSSVGSRAGAERSVGPAYPCAPRFLWECLTSRTVSWFPAPATSNPAGGFPALGFPACFMPKLMGPILLAGLSAPADEPGTR
jgi:hypothetical protein